MMIGRTTVILFILTGCKGGWPCVSKSAGEDSIACVCNATYCDSIEQFNDHDIQNGSYVHYETNMAGKRLHFKKGKFSKRIEPRCFFDKITSFWTTTITVDTTVKYQEIFGFGGALTDSVGILLSQLKEETQEQLLRQYFSDEGLNYKFIRLPIAASDFSTHWYTYDDLGEGHSLTNFSLCEEDYKYKIPYIKKIENISSTHLKIIAVPWIAPRRMLEPRYFKFYTLAMRLKDEYYPIYAEYITKFLDSYKKEGITIWGLTPQNEPKNGLYGGLYPVNLGWTPWEQGEWIGNNLGPMLRCNGFGDIKIIIYDGQRDMITFWTSIVMGYAKKYISGISIHWYLDWPVPPSFISRAHYTFPDLFILSTEASICHKFFSKPVRIGRWENLELYINSIADVMNNWGSGWLDWNLVLDEIGGPSFMKNWLDSPTIINTTANEFYKQPTWYGIAHYSHFVPPGSRRINLKEWFANGITGSAFLTPEDRVVIVLLNRRDSTYEAIINIGKEEQIKISMTSRSLHTIIYKNTPEYN